MHDAASATDRLQGAEVAMTGRLASMTRPEAKELIAALGGRYVTRPTRQTRWLVVGQEGLPLSSDGALSRQLQRVRRLQADGCPVKVLQESEFLELLGLEDRQQDVHRRYTAAQLGKLLKVSRDRLRWWIKAGLIEPVEARHGLAWFDFSQVAAARTLVDLTRSGVTPARLRQSLRQLRSWLPGAEQSLAQLNVLERSGRLLVRLDDGQLAEPSGQLQLGFMDALEDAQAAAVASTTQSAEDWYEIAAAHEEAGRLRDAAEAYRQALLLGGPDSVVCFNLGNVLYAQSQPQQAVERFRQAVEIDPQYVEAWNNLGTVLAELGQRDEALGSFRKAIKIEATYADAHYNLADTLDELGRTDEAASHWKQYLRLDPTGAWADYARTRLEQTQRRPG